VVGVIIYLPPASLERTLGSIGNALEEKGATKRAATLLLGIPLPEMFPGSPNTGVPLLEARAHKKKRFRTIRSTDTTCSWFLVFNQM
jgi:hypothetical protein